MEIFDFRFIVNTAIGSAIGGSIAVLVTLPAVLAWFGKNWSNWIRAGIAFSPPVVIIALLFLIVPRLEDWLDDWASHDAIDRHARLRASPEAFVLSCGKGCKQNERVAIQNCNNVANLYSNPATRIDLLQYETLSSMLPEPPPEPRFFYGGRKESPYSFDIIDLAERVFDGCIRKMGYTFEPCETGKQCYIKRPSFSYYDYKHIKFSQYGYRELTDASENGIYVELLGMETNQSE